MKALTLHQPWATLVAIGAKRIETRSWNTSYRGPLAIHAGMNKGYIDMRGNDYIVDEEPFYSVMMNAGQIWKHGPWPLGAIIATCDLVHVHRVDTSDWMPHQRGWEHDGKYWEASAQEKAFGNYEVGRYMWLLDNVQIATIPIPVKGARMLWEWEPVVANVVE